MMIRLARTHDALIGWQIRNFPKDIRLIWIEPKAYESVKDQRNCRACGALITCEVVIDKEEVSANKQKRNGARTREMVEHVVLSLLVIDKEEVSPNHWRGAYRNHGTKGLVESCRERERGRERERERERENIDSFHIGYGSINMFSYK